MEYTLKALLNDKHLRAAVVKEDFSFRDGNDVVTCLDFENETMLKNHRAFYDFLCETGGEALLNKLLAQGNTCLTDDPNAANSGVRKIKGTDKYFLMTNAGDPKVLASVLWGVQGLSEVLEGFEAEKVFILVKDEEETEEDGEEMELDTELELENTELEAEEEEEKRLPPHYNVSLVQKDGRYALYDNDENAFFTLECERVPGGVISTMAICEPLMAPPCREDQSDCVGEEAVQLGWKYKLEDRDYEKWGWISEDCTLVQEPEFSEIEVHCDGRDYMREEMRLLARSYMGFYCSDGWNPLRLAFRDMWNDIPENEPLCVEGKWDWSLIYWKADHDVQAGCLAYRGELETVQFKVRFQDGVLKIWEGNDPAQVSLCEKLKLEACEACFTFDRKEGIPGHNFSGIYLKPSEYLDAIRLYEDEETEKEYFAVQQKDGYWGIIETRGNVRRLCTPAAFTHISVFSLQLGLAAVEQFGKWGVYDIPHDKYIVPCDYESVSFDRREFCVEVRRMNFKGLVTFNGNWRKHLHREEG